MVSDNPIFVLDIKRIFDERLAWMRLRLDNSTSWLVLSKCTAYHWSSLCQTQTAEPILPSWAPKSSMLSNLLKTTKASLLDRLRLCRVEKPPRRTIPRFTITRKLKRIIFARSLLDSEEQNREKVTVTNQTGKKVERDRDILGPGEAKTTKRLQVETKMLKPENESSHRRKGDQNRSRPKNQKNLMDQMHSWHTIWVRKNLRTRDHWIMQAEEGRIEFSVISMLIINPRLRIYDLLNPWTILS